MTWAVNKKVLCNCPKKFSSGEGLLWKTIFSISVLHDCWHLFKLFALLPNNYSTNKDKINNLKLGNLGTGKILELVVLCFTLVQVRSSCSAAAEAAPNFL